MHIRVITDPNPCLRYRWNKRCQKAYSGAHVCEYGGGHAGECRCGQCDARGRGIDRAAVPSLSEALGAVGVLAT